MAKYITLAFVTTAIFSLSIFYSYYWTEKPQIPVLLPKKVQQPTLDFWKTDAKKHLEKRKKRLRERCEELVDEPRTKVNMFKFSVEFVKNTTLVCIPPKTGTTNWHRILTAWQHDLNVNQVESDPYA